MANIKKIIFTAISVIFFTLFTSGAVFAQGMMGNNMMSGNNSIAQSGDGHTAREEAEGKAIWEKLQAEELKCEDLSDDDFGVLGEYFMGQMAGEQHEAMNNMMIQMIGEEGEKQIHITMGKRMSNCEPDAPMPQAMMNGGMMPMMMDMMMGNWGQNPIWRGGVGLWLISLLWLVWLVVGILAAVWLWKQIIKK